MINVIDVQFSSETSDLKREPFFPRWKCLLVHKSIFSLGEYFSIPRGKTFIAVVLRSCDVKMCHTENDRTIRVRLVVGGVSPGLLLLDLDT